MKKLIYSKEDLDLILSLELDEKDKEIKRLNNIINELEKWLEENGKYIDDSDYAAIYVEDIMNKLKELKGSDK